MPAICLLNLQFGLAIFTEEVCRGVLRANDPCFSEMHIYSWPLGSFLCNRESDKLLLMSTKIFHPNSDAVKLELLLDSNGFLEFWVCKY
jgi:hypothetical protein